MLKKYTVKKLFGFGTYDFCPILRLRVLRKPDGLYLMVDMLDDAAEQFEKFLQQRMGPNWRLVERLPEVGRVELFSGIRRDEFGRLQDYMIEAGWSLLPNDYDPDKKKSNYRQHDEAIFQGTLMVGGRQIRGRLCCYPPWPDIHDHQSEYLKIELKWKTDHERSFRRWEDAKRAFTIWMSTVLSEAGLTPVDLPRAKGTPARLRVGAHQALALALAAATGSVTEATLKDECNRLGRVPPYRDQALDRLSDQGQLSRSEVDEGRVYYPRHPVRG